MKSIKLRPRSIVVQALGDGCTEDCGPDRSLFIRITCIRTHFVIESIIMLRGVRKVCQEYVSRPSPSLLVSPQPEGYINGCWLVKSLIGMSRFSFLQIVRLAMRPVVSSSDNSWTTRGTDERYILLRYETSIS